MNYGLVQFYEDKGKLQANMIGAVQISSELSVAQEQYGDWGTSGIIASSLSSLILRYKSDNNSTGENVDCELPNENHC